MSNCQLYLITPPSFELVSFTNQVKQAFQGGVVACFQLRLKNASDDEILRAAEKIIPICKENHTTFIINDRADLALKSGADGVHLGEKDTDVKKAREMLGDNGIIGVSCYDSRHLAMEAGEQGADYVSFGTFFPSKTKQSKGNPTTEILEWCSTYTNLPCVAIGGITPENCAPLVKAGADFIAVISAIWDHPKNPKKAVEEFIVNISKA